MNLPATNYKRGDRQPISVESLGLTWFFLVSVIVHFTMLWTLPSLLRHTPRVFSPFSIISLTPLDSESGSASSTAPPNGKGTALRHARPVARARPATPSRPEQSSLSSGELSESATGPSGSGSGLGEVVTDGGGAGTGGIGVPAGPSGAGQGSSGKGVGPGTGTGTAKSPPGPPGAKPGPPAAERFAIPVPPAIQRTTSPYESEVYAEIDFYTLFTPDLRSSVNVPANQVCLDGNIIRTYERQLISHTVTDISKCRYEDYSDKDEMRCPKEAHTTVVTYNNFLSSPVNYSVNLCLTYDRSSCYWAMNDDGPDLEVCRARGKYEGLWAEGTMFHYPCAKSTSQSFSHPLQYEVRFVQDVEFPEERMRRRLVYRETRPLAQCQQ